MKIINADCLSAMQKMASDSFDSIVTDPPYGLSFMGKKWDYDVPSMDIWRECLRVLKPGGHLLAFAGTRTQHRMAVRIEDAGFEIRDMIAWVYGSGFPKSRDISKDMDRSAGAQREVVGKVNAPGMARANVEQGAQGRSVYSFDKLGDPVTDAARQWQGWGTALKPSLEPISVARKPLKGTVAANVLAHGTGALNIDGCRVGTDTVKVVGPADGGRKFARKYDHNGENLPNVTLSEHTGRWPANLIHDGSEEVVAGFPDRGKAGTAVRKNGKSASSIWGSGNTDPDSDVSYGDSGSAARFFYCAKASKADRDEGCEGLDYFLSDDCPASVKKEIEALLTSMR